MNAKRIRRGLLVAMAAASMAVAACTPGSGGSTTQPSAPAASQPAASQPASVAPASAAPSASDQKGNY